MAAEIEQAKALFTYTSVHAEESEVIIVGGGLAGLIAALLLQSEGKQVLVMEARDYPRHKVCGEFISREVVPLFDKLNLWPEYELPQIRQLRLSVASGRELEMVLSHGAFGWSRYHLDQHLAQLYTARGGKLLTRGPVRQIGKTEAGFKVETADGRLFQARILMAAVGKKSSIDKAIGLGSGKRSPWMGWKMHFELPDFPTDRVELHNFSGGYAGLSRVEKGRINMAALVDSRLVKGKEDAWKLALKAFRQNPYMREFLDQAKPLLEKPVAVSQLEYGNRPQVSNGVLLLGDSAGMIHPLSGNGMAMAIGSAQLAVEAAISFLNGTIDQSAMEGRYQKSWRQHYHQRLRVSRLLRAFFAASGKSEWAMQAALALPTLTRWLERQTHGKAPAL